MSQETFIQKLLDQTGMKCSKLVEIPIEETALAGSSVLELLDEYEQAIYRSVKRSSMRIGKRNRTDWLVVTDILASYLNGPKLCHMIAAK